MSTLQISLAVIGVVLLALIVAYNAWTTHRNQPKKARPVEDDPRAEPALRQEPAFDAALGAPPVARGSTAPPRTPVASAAPGAPAPEELPGADFAPPDRTGQAAASAAAPDAPVPVAPTHVADRRPGLDPLIDAIAALQCEHAIPGESALAALPPTRRVGSKPFAIEGFNETTQQWEMPTPGERYHLFQAGVQLANRVGALNDIEFSEFVHKAQAFADSISASIDFPDMVNEVLRARELDHFASEHDAQLAFMLRARQAAWSAGYLQQNAARLGFVQGAIPGRMLLPAPTPGLPPLLGLSFDTQAALAEDLEQSAVRELMLSLDVAQVHRTEQPFARLREIAAVLCNVMDGVLCDQNGQPLPAMAMDPIATDLELLYDQLDGRELSAGSVLARRLFS